MQVQTIEVCCAPVLAEPLTPEAAEELAAGFKVLSDPVRLRILSLIATAPGREVCACDLTEPVGRSQPTVSHHLSILADAGLLTREQRGKWAWFRVVPEKLAVLRQALETEVPA
jgi:ArsR family transcriptional regulator